MWVPPFGGRSFWILPVGNVGARKCDRRCDASGNGYSFCYGSARIAVPLVATAFSPLYGRKLKSPKPLTRKVLTLFSASPLVETGEAGMLAWEKMLQVVGDEHRIMGMSGGGGRVSQAQG